MKQDRSISEQNRVVPSSLCCFNTVDLWALLAAKLQSPTELCAYFLCPPLDHMEHEGHRDMVYHRFVCVKVCVCVYMYCLFAK